MARASRAVGCCFGGSGLSSPFGPHKRPYGLALRSGGSPPPASGYKLGGFFVFRHARRYSVQFPCDCEALASKRGSV
jgi:hypothetical protein